MSKAIQATPLAVVRSGFSIAAKRYEPQTKTQRVPVILSHGFLSTQERVAKYAQALASWGYTAYTLDFVGGAARNESSGTMADMSLETEKADLLALMDRVQGETGSEKVILLGCSQGGFVSAMAAGERPAAVEKLILFYPALCIPDDAKSGRMMFFRFDPHHVPEKVRGHFGTAISQAYIQGAQRIDPMAMVCRYPGDVLFVHGTRDRIVNFSYALRAREALLERPTGSLSFLALQGADHGFKKREDEVVFGALSQFLRGRREVLTVDVHVDKASTTRSGLDFTTTIPFDGFAKGALFEGVIQPGATDVQKRHGYKPVSFCAEYTLHGVDWAGTVCTVHVKNQTQDGVHWTPEIETDSPNLRFLNDRACEAILEPRKVGPVVHIYA